MNRKQKKGVIESGHEQKIRSNSFNEVESDEINVIQEIEKTTSICPICHKIIDAIIEERDDNYVWMRKSCSEHGYFEDKIWYNAEVYKRFQKSKIKGRGIINSKEVEKGCPYDCGPCKLHETYTMLTIFDITNRCNLHCPICFANADSTGRVYDPSINEIRSSLELITKFKPQPRTIMFSGGEPTIRKDLPEIITLSKKEFNFNTVLLATNGIKLAQSEEYCQLLKDSGVDIVYLQFDGLNDEIYKEIRGKKLFDIKCKVIENCRKVNLYISFVITVVKGINDDQIADILQFAFDNIDIVKAVNYQPVSFAGRIDQQEIKSKRITNGDLINIISMKTNGLIKEEDWSSIPRVAPFEKSLNLIYGKKGLLTSTHPTCGTALYVFRTKNKDGTVEFLPLSRFVNFDKFLDIIDDISSPTGNISNNSRVSRVFRLIKLIRALNKNIYHDKVPYYVDMRFRTLFKRALRRKPFFDAEKIKSEFIFIGSMHFMDGFNFDFERLKKCCIHYSTLDGRLIPFCAYNNFTFYREEIEKKYHLIHQKNENQVIDTKN